MRVAKIKVAKRRGRTEYFKTYYDVYDEAKRFFEKELKENSNLDGLLCYNITVAMDKWNSTQKQYVINL